MPPVRVLVVDDSVLMRGLLKKMLAQQHDIQIIGTAVNGLDALAKIKSLKPDAVTLDVEMPELDGLSALRRIMLECPVPVIMCSSLTDTGTRATIEALSAGAVDFIAKPKKTEALGPVVEELAVKIITASGARLIKPRLSQIMSEGDLHKKGRPVPERRKTTGELSNAAKEREKAAMSRRIIKSGVKVLSMTMRSVHTKLVAIGCSTGGPAALQQVLPALPAKFPTPVVVVQHIPIGFSKALAEQLNTKCQLEVHHAEDGMQLQVGHIYIAQAGSDITFRGRGDSVTLNIEKGVTPLPPGGFRPSADVMMTDAARAYGDTVLGVLMTGMGRDGAKGMKAIKNNGGRTIAEDESTCVVYGMPKAAVDAKAVDKVTPLGDIAQEIINML